MKIKNDEQAYLHALVLSITAPTDEKSQECIQIAEDYTNFYIDALNERLEGFTLNATYKCFESPREYNFETDRIFIEIEENHAVDFIEHIVQNYKKELEKKIEDRFRSRSGFISFYKNSIDLWAKDFKEWDCNMIGTCFELFDFDELHFYESLSETIINNLGNTLGKDGIDLLDKKQKEKDKKELIDKQQLKLNFN